jgi:hypothetical protein
MLRIRPLNLLAIAFPLLATTAPVASNSDALGQAPKPPALVGSITGISEPTTRQVVQRRDDNVGDILIIGTYTGNVDGFQARSFVRPGMLGQALGWTALQSVIIFEGHFIGTLRQPAGGFYDLQVRPTYGNQVGTPANIYAVGVGEVFITAGQSNTTNSGSSTGFSPDIRVSSFNPGPGLGIDPAFPGASWQYGIDPQPALDQTIGGSTWPTMANNLAVVLNVPVGLYSAGCGGTEIHEWLPGYVKPATYTTPPVILFNRLVGAINYFNNRGGARAVLWLQGESDYGNGTDPVTYQNQLKTVIDQSRAATGVPIKWMVGRTTSPLNANPTQKQAIRAAQGAVVDNLLTFPGPDADSIGLAYRNESSYGPLHFDAPGVVLLGNYWGIYVYNIPGFLAPGALTPR